MSFKASVSSSWYGEEVKLIGKKVVGLSAFEIGLVVEGQAKLLSPVDTGRLAASITTQGYEAEQSTQPRGKKAIASDVIARPAVPGEVYVGTPVFYGPYIEFGTIRSAAQPFLRPALALAQGKSLDIVKKNGRYEFAKYLRP